MKLPALKDVRRSLLADLGVPDEVLDYIDLKPTFDARDTKRALAGSGIELPPLESYADKLWDYWRRNSTPTCSRTARSRRGQRQDGAHHRRLERHRQGGRAQNRRGRRIPLLVARSEDKLNETKEEIERDGGTAYAYTADLSDYDSIDALVEKIFSEHPAVDMLVNNAGRSIRRSVGGLL